MYSSPFWHTSPAQLALQQHQQFTLIIYYVTTTTLHTLLVILQSHCLIIMRNSLYWPTNIIPLKIQRRAAIPSLSKNMISQQLGNIDCEHELCLERNNVNVSSECLINRLMHFWFPLKKVYNKRKKN